jgi:predicted small lipoprotein YifL
MKKLNLLLIPVLLSSLLIGCGVKGPLYRASTIEKQPTTPEKEVAEPKIETENILS